MMSRGAMRQLAERLATIADKDELKRLLGMMTPLDLIHFDACFEAWRNEAQMPPAGEGWRTWLMMAGRGFGKTRAGAEWITSLATQAGRPVRIALVAATPADARAVMIEGESGLISVGRYHRKEPRWEPSRGRLVWPGGSEARVFSGAEPDGLRGPAHHFAWCDELAKWERPQESWDNLQMTLRCGARPRALVTTTPRPIPILTRIEKAPHSVVTRGSTEQNRHLPEAFIEEMIATYGGTRLGRQELEGLLIEDVEGALWSRELIERCRILPGTGARRAGHKGDVRAPQGEAGGSARSAVEGALHRQSVARCPSTMLRRRLLRSRCAIGMFPRNMPRRARPLPVPGRIWCGS